MKGKWKQGGKKKKGNVVLQKYMVAVGEFVKSKNVGEETESDHRLRFVKKKSRKELRKEKRKQKKARMKCYYERKGTVIDGDNEPTEKIADKEKRRKNPLKTNKDVPKSLSNKADGTSTEKTPTSKKSKKKNKLQESRKMALLEANEEEDREIKKLERFLRLNKRKNKKTLPQSFVADGLDYILGVLDSSAVADGMYDSDDNLDIAKQNFEKLDDSQLSDKEREAADETASEGSVEDMGSHEEEEEEAGDEEMEDALDESDAADHEIDGETEEEGEEEEADTETPASNSPTVSSQPSCLFFVLVFSKQWHVVYSKFI